MMQKQSTTLSQSSCLFVSACSLCRRQEAALGEVPPYKEHSEHRVQFHPVKRHIRVPALQERLSHFLWVRINPPFRTLVRMSLNSLLSPQPSNNSSYAFINNVM